MFRMLTLWRGEINLIGQFFWLVHWESLSKPTPTRKSYYKHKIRARVKDFESAKQ